MSLLLGGGLPVMAQRITSLQNVVDFGQVLYNHPVTAEFELTNNGPDDVVIRDAKVSCGCTVARYPRERIPSGRKFQVQVTFDARQLGHFNKEVGLYCDDKDSPYYFRLSGVVVSELTSFKGNLPYALDGFKADRNDLEFDDVNKGDMPVQKIHIQNVSQQTLQPQLMHLPPYLSGTVSPSRVAPGKDAVISLRLDSRKVRDLGLNQTSFYLGRYPGDKVAENKEISMSVVLLPDFADYSNSDLAVAPHLKMSKSSLYLGKFGKKDKLKGVIEIENTGKSTLEIRSLQMFTNGLEVSLSNSSLGPGEKAKLRVTAIKSGIRKARSKPRILMITNDPRQSKVVVHINTI